jgi:hypothetical protein
MMTAIRMIVLIVMACLALGCSQPRHDAPASIFENSRPNATVAGNISRTDSITGAALVSFIQHTGAILDTVLCAEGNYIVAATRQGAHADIVTLRYDSTGIHKVGSDMRFDQLPYPTVQLVRVGQRVVLRVTTFDALAEDITGTAVDRIDANGIHREFADPVEGCKAADFSGRYGVYTLRTYVDSPFARDCLSPCAEDLRKVMGSEPAEVVVLQRNNDGLWKHVAAVTDSTVSRGYLRAADALHNGSVRACAADSAHVLRSIAKWQAGMQ